jgi:hypothetical protein
MGYQYIENAKAAMDFSIPAFGLAARCKWVHISI